MSDSTDAPFSMLNALWFKPEGGAETYRAYLKAAGPFAVKHGAVTRDRYTPEESLIGDFDADLIFFVDWPSQHAFEQLLHDPGYQAIAHLREEALRDSLLIRCQKH